MISHAEFARLVCEEAEIIGRHLVLRWFAATVSLFPVMSANCDGESLQHCNTFARIRAS